MADVNAALKMQGMEGYKFMPGDAIVFRTGWEAYWEDPPKYNDGCPGIGMEVARWIAEEIQAGITAADTWPVDAVPNPDPDCVFCVHNYLQTRHGIVNQENLRLTELAEAGVYEFAYFFAVRPRFGAPRARTAIRSRSGIASTLKRKAAGRALGTRSVCLSLCADSQPWPTIPNGSTSSSPSADAWRTRRAP